VKLGTGETILVEVQINSMLDQAGSGFTWWA
jgi:hypothetical protein